MTTKALNGIIFFTGSIFTRHEQKKHSMYASKAKRPIQNSTEQQMASFNVRRISDFDVNAVTFSAVRKNTMGGKVVYLNGSGNSKLLFQLPQQA